MSAITITNLRKSFLSDSGPLPVLDGISLSIERGRFVTFFGPNGCGKSTLVNIIGGIETSDSGTVIKNVGKDGRTAFVCQDYRATLLPWANVQSNILFPLSLHGVSRDEGKRRLDMLLTLLDVSIKPKAHVYNLSGGQAQLVALLRALIVEPEILILDEPFSALDYQASNMLREKLLVIWQRLGLTVLFISHDLDEALYLGDETVFLSRQPARVVEVLPIMLPRPRALAVQATAKFADLKARALEIFSRCLGNEPKRQAIGGRSHGGQ
jgi:NitT/TauT family transport system ATP-binding protein